MGFFISRFDPAQTYAGFNPFDCQHHAINTFVKGSLKKQVKQGLCVAYALLEASGHAEPDRFAGFYTIASHAIPLSALSGLQLGSLPKTIPCIRLIMLGIHSTDAHKGLGSQLVNHALNVVKSSAICVGGFGLYLDADAGAVDVYRKLGFVLLDGDKSPSPSPMFITLSAMG